MASDDGQTGDAGADSCRCKVGRVAAAHGLTDLDETLVAYWRGDGREQYSLRQLETYVNRAVLGAAMREAGWDPIDGEVENVHRLLVADEVSEGDRTEMVQRLEHEGVDVASVRGDFVSHQTIHTHLRDCLSVNRETPDPTPEARRETVEGTVFALQNRTEAVTRGSLERLRAADGIALDTFDVLVDVSVTCEACGRVYDVDTLLDRGGCECQLD